MDDFFPYGEAGGNPQYQEIHRLRHEIKQLKEDLQTEQGNASKTLK